MIETLQSLRFIFIMMIFMSHFAYRGIGPFDAGGDCGVAFFFMLSKAHSVMAVSCENGSVNYIRYIFFVCCFGSSSVKALLTVTSC